MNKGLPKIPDTQAISPEGVVGALCIAMELERVIKTDRRYECVICAYISVIKANQR
jgi:hypothetical protein